jgi:hypothetical protein
MKKSYGVHSTQPLNTHARRPPTPQERADELLQRWRLARTAGIPAADRLDREDRQ